MNNFTDRVNYYNDSRVSRANAPNNLLYTEDDEEIELPMKWEVCNSCNGVGKHINPSIDAGGISASDFEDDPEFAEDYFGGTYDVTCYCCNGRTTVQVVDRDRMTDEQIKLWDAQLEDEADSHACHMAELRMGA